MRRSNRRAATATPASALGRGGRGRMAPADDGLRAVHQQVLRSFATTGRPPAASDLAETAARHNTTVEAVLAALHTGDFLQLGTGGQIRAAYPFSTVPTAHQVDLHGGPRVYAMCAIDALGIAAMIHAEVTITSADPHNGDPVTITVQADGATAAWQPPAAVVFAGRHASRGGDARGPVQVIPAAADVSCGYVNFFSSAASAAAWASGHPEATGDILGHAAALRLGTAIFGPLPPDLAADTPMKRRVDRLLPRSGLPTVACFAAVIGLLSLAPHLPVRADLAADGLAALAGAAWCGVNFWRCRHAHCAVTSTGWLVLCILAFAGTGVGHSLISGYEQPVFLAVLGAALAFEIVWRRARGTGALGPGVSHQHSDSQAPHS